MSQDEDAVSVILDEMAVKIVMAEPGEFSVVEELLAAAEELVANAELADRLPVLNAMSRSLRSTLEQLLTGGGQDTAATYELLGQAVDQLQRVLRKGDYMDEAGIAAYARYLSAVGHYVSADELLAYQVTPQAEAEPDDDSAAALESDAGPASVASADEGLPGETAQIEEPAESADSGDSVPDLLQDKELVGGFICEAFEHLQSIEVNVLELEQNHGDPDIINNIFRPFHTIKGVSGFLGLGTINKLAHATENLLDDVRNNKRSMNSDVIDLVLNVGDSLREMVENIKDVLENGADRYRELDISVHISQIRNLQDGDSPLSDSTLEEQSTLEVPEEEKEDTAWVRPHDCSPAQQGLAAGEQSPGRAFSATAAVDNSGPARASEISAETPAAKGQVAARQKKMRSSIKVDVDKLDAMINAVGELVIMQSLVRQNPLVSQIADPKLVKDFSQLSRITSELQHTAMSMRMVPIKQTFDKMIRLVRDLSKKSDKQVNLVMEGAETEIDRNMVDSIYDPLVHMMRNSLDHGIQTPDERVRHGKPPTGTVSLRAYQKGGNMVIEIEDDGEGLNTAKIRKKAERRGLIKPGDNLSDFELNNLIFMPGFSTADQITDVSGRGVGMDVVKKVVKKLRGKVDVQSKPGKGSLFTIRLPLTLAIIDGIIVRVGSERYIIPTLAIQSSIKPERKDYNTVHGRGESLMVRDELLPIIRLYQLFGVDDPTHTDPCEAIVVVVENEGRRRALMVDELLGKEEVVIKNLGGMSDVQGVAGGTILGDGRVGLILDLAGIIATTLE